MVEFSMWTVLTVLSERPPTDPMDKPWPPEQVPPVKMMFFNFQYRSFTQKEEGTYCARVDSQAIILILHNSVRDGNTIGVTNIKRICVVSTCRITSRVINRNRVESESLSTVNAENLHGGVQDFEVADGR